jgi:hypothetical protein
MIAVKPILPGGKALKVFQKGVYTRAWERTRDQAISKARDEVKSITRSWTKPPGLSVKQEPWGATLSIDDPRWLYADLGTKRHVIRPRAKKFLKFSVGGQTVFARKVNHPGQKARYLTKQVQGVVDRLNMAATFANLVGELTR